MRKNLDLISLKKMLLILDTIIGNRIMSLLNLISVSKILLSMSLKNKKAKENKLIKMNFISILMYKRIK
jgi:hypothetical protein